MHLVGQVVRQTLHFATQPTNLWPQNNLLIVCQEFNTIRIGLAAIIVWIFQHDNRTPPIDSLLKIIRNDKHGTIGVLHSKQWHISFLSG